MATAPVTTPPLPPGFTLDNAPPLPPGFSLDGPPSAAPPEQSASLADKMVGGWGGRMLMGMASPLLAGAQLLGGETGRKGVAELEAMKQRGMAAEGKSGFDAYGLLGSLIPGAGIAKGVSAALPAATSVLGRAGVGMAQGAAAAAAQPSAGIEASEYFPNKAGQVGLGAAVGGAVPLVVDAAKGVGGIVKQAAQPFYDKGRRAILKEFRRGLLGNDEATIAKVIDAAENPQTFLSRPTTGEVLADIPEATGLAAHQKDVASLKGVSPGFTARTAEQEATRAGVLSPIAKTKADLVAAEAARDQATGPMRDAALARANLGGQQVPPLERQRAVAEALLAKSNKQLSQVGERAARGPKVGMPVEPSPGALKSAIDIHAPYSPPKLQSTAEKTQRMLAEEVASKKAGGFTQAALDAQSTATAAQRDITGATQKLAELEAQGLRPLKANSIVANVEKNLVNAEARGSDIGQKSLKGFKQMLLDAADEQGNINAKTLYQLRKEGLGEKIESFSDPLNKASKQSAARYLREAQLAIDDAIEGAGGTGWKDYLAKFHDLSREPNRMRVGQGLESALQNPLKTGERGQSFAKAVGELDDRALASLTATEKADLDKMVSELARLDKFNKLASKTSLSGGDTAIPGRVGLTLPNILSRPAMIANFMLKHAGSSAEGKIAKIAAEEALDPKLFAKALKDVPSRYKPMIEALLRQAGPAASTTAARNY